MRFKYVNSKKLKLLYNKILLWKEKGRIRKTKSSIINSGIKIIFSNDYSLALLGTEIAPNDGKKISVKVKEGRKVLLVYTETIITDCTSGTPHIGDIAKITDSKTQKESINICLGLIDAGRATDTGVELKRYYKLYG
ncbi:hypothetical protein BCR32DRAFT_245376 [Anaeromyces robustus]|uniref:Uncharacterized protein n=1 Tax=Anaeromyces robustus TaxID=1754192 RepID=A0A1Y1X566_9FUNG|nr:hypothetical protein BCR32DRAFT_245376 [Anaeromyces robustus]|eukprot:ORX80798.1 hypothetical protein BCR32DRAFT_245376 [Anaeromyces robustus]